MKNIKKKMKPKHRVMCPDCGRSKIQFETKEKAERFIKFNGKEITDDISKLRVYYCESCNCYHITSKKYKKTYKYSTQNLIERYKKDVKYQIPSFYEFWFKSLNEDVKHYGEKKFKKWLRENTEYNCNEIGEINKIRKLYIEHENNN